MHCRRVSLDNYSGVLGTVEAGALLREAGVRVPEHVLCQTPEEAAAATKFSSSVALKIESRDILHKTDAGGVRLGLGELKTVKAAFEDITRETALFNPAAVLDGVIVARMVEPGIEMVIGLNRDPSFGNVIMVGLGGVFVEVMEDIAIRLCPVTPVEAIHMLDSLKCAPILKGARGGPQVDKEKLAQMIVDVSHFGASIGEGLVELDLNPVFAGPDGAVAVDWLLVAKS